MSRSKITNSEAQDSFNQSANADEGHIQKIIKGLQDFLRGEIIEHLEHIFKQIDNTPRIFEDFEYIVNCHYILINMVDSLITYRKIHLEKQLFFCYA